MRTQRILFALLVAVAFVSTGCFSFQSAPPPSVAGVFKSFDFTENWTPKLLLLHSGGVGNISGVAILNIVFDPQDFNAVYLATASSGLLYSYDGGDSWMTAKGIGGRVESVAVDPTDKCTIYATQNNTLTKTDDCGRTWREIYIDTDGTKALTAVVIDGFSPENIYAGNISGDILKSNDGGLTWRVVHRLNNRVMKFLMAPEDTRVIYAVTQNSGIFKTIDAGGEWKDMNEGLRPFSGSFEYKHLIFVPSEPNALLLAAKYGLLISRDGAVTWTPLQLITPPATTDIFAVAIHPENSNEIYYATGSTFYKTVDGGANWTTKRLPTTARPSQLVVDPTRPNTIYFGFTNQ